RKRGVEFEVAHEKETEEKKAEEKDSVEPTEDSENEQAEPQKEKTSLYMLDLHEVRKINEYFVRLKEYGIKVEDLIPAGLKGGESFYPFVIRTTKKEVTLGSLRGLLNTLRKVGEDLIQGRITRFKGLGEMDADELWLTTMDPEVRNLLQITMEDAAGADEIFRILMGDHVEPRREFIEKYALDVKDSDI
ncbi:MAG: DNA gyrase subunit B, partial [Planctomycetaceae bacterium]|nr:DNA gyrase subunit B [Planctomycetaceae bacterium]